MINLSDFQPLSIAKIKTFSSTSGFLQKILSDKVHAILIEEVTMQTTLRDGTSFRKTHKYNYRTKIFTSAFIKVSF